MAASQVVTIVCTDLVGSTELFARLDPAVADQLRETHLSLLRGAVESNGGTEVKNSHDGLMVVFPVTSGALNGAEAMQRAIELHNGMASLPLSIRIGLSHGEVIEDAGDYVGDAVIEADRLCAKASGGQILATEIVRKAAGRRAKQEFVSFGEFEPTDLSDPVAIVEVLWEPVEAIESDGLIPLPAQCVPTPSDGFVGRVAERALLDEALKKVSSEARRHHAFIGGEPGMGKTTLASEFARYAHDDGVIVLFGGADEDLTAPYEPWVEAVTHLVTHAPEALLESLAPHAGSLVRLAPALGVQFPLSDPPPTSDPEAARYILFSDVASTLQAACELAPVVLVLDDLQWADTESLQLLRYVAATCELSRLLVIGIFRDSDIEMPPALDDLLVDLRREPECTRISLLGLDDLELLAMMEGAAGQEMDENGLALRDALLAETNGNPFFVGELLRHLVESGAIFQQNGHWVGSTDLRVKGLPVSVREVIGQRVAQLGEEGARALEIASVMGRDFELELLMTVSERDEDCLLDVCDVAVEAALVVEVAGDRFSFVHALIEHTLYDSLVPARRASLHQAVAEAIESQTRGRTEGRVGELAYHWARAAAPENLEKAVHYAGAAGDAALTQLAPDEALRWYTQALGLLDQHDPGATRLRCSLLVGLGNAQRQTGSSDYRETLLHAAHLAQEMDESELLVAAALANNRGLTGATGVVDAERVAVLEAASAVLEGAESAERAQLLALLASELTYCGDLTRPRQLADQALGIARRCDPATVAAVVSRSTTSFSIPETLTHRLALTAEALDAAQLVGDPVLQFWCGISRFITLCQAGQVAEGDVVLQLIRAISERLGQPILRWFATYFATSRALLAGDLDTAERLAMEALEIGNATGQPDALIAFAAQIGNVRICQGRAEELVDLIGQLARETPGIPGLSTFLGQIYCDLDRFDEAREVLEPYVADGFESIPKDPVWILSMSHIAYVATHLRWIEAAEVLIDRLRPFADQLVFIGSNALGAVSCDLGMLAGTLGHEAEAEQYFSQAAVTLELNGVAWGLAVNQLAWGQCLVNGDKPEDRSRASALLEGALESSRALGFGLVERRSLQALETLGNR
jgi:class 3 adenylate cyclase/tetratricopeptide (TPR) repeat protein